MSSFRKRNVRKQQMPGTRTSPQTGQIITSCGNPSLDVLFGGGLPLGSICLIEEDKFVTHSKVLAKYFLAEGILSQQFTFLGSLDEDPVTLLQKLPKPLNEDEAEKENADEVEQNGDESSKNGLRIAWRYSDLPMVTLEHTPTKIGHHFNLLEHMDPVMLEYAKIAVWNDVQQNTQQQQQGINEESSDDGEEDDEVNMNENITGGAGDSEIKDDAMDTNSTEDCDTKKTDVENEENAATIDCNADASVNIEKDENLKKNDTEAMDVDSTQQLTATSPTTTTTTTTASESSGSATAVDKKQKIFENPKYLRLLNELHQLLRADKFSPGTLHYKGVCRVCITSLGSPNWYEENFEQDLLKFLTILRALVRSALSVCFITMPMHLVAKYDVNLVAKIRNLVDYAIELESFAGSDYETNPAYKEYNGLLHIHKTTAINALTSYKPETTDLAFKLRRKKFVIEKLHLPPELQENNNETNGNVNTPKLSCSINSNANSSLDF